jgi:hypothetical protein
MIYMFNSMDVDLFLFQKKLLQEIKNSRISFPGLSRPGNAKKIFITFNSLCEPCYYLNIQFHHNFNKNSLQLRVEVSRE